MCPLDFFHPHQAAGKESASLIVPILPVSISTSTRPGQQVDDVKNTRPMVASKPTVGRQSLTSAPLQIHDHYWPRSSESASSEQHYHQRLNKLLDRHQIKQLKHLRNGEPSPGLSRSGRYSLGPSASSNILMPVCEIPRLESSESLHHTRTISANNSLHVSETLVDGQKPIPITCSPSKLARVSVKTRNIAVSPPLSKNCTPRSVGSLSIEPPELEPPTQQTSSEICNAFEDDEEEDLVENRLHNRDEFVEDDANLDTEDPESHVVNTSLGINSAMTGLALVTRTQSTGSKNSGCDVDVFVATPSPTVPNTQS